MLNSKTSLTVILLIGSLLSINSAKSMIPALGDENCTSLLLVSSWDRNNVKIYDGCSGQFIRDLDSQNLINGPLGILQAPDGDLLVISENNSRMLKFDRATLSVGSVVMGDDPATSEVENNFISGPSGAVLDENGFIYAASYTRNEVVKIDPQTWQIVEQMLPAYNGLIQGIDAGITISDGHLYLPGFDSNNIIKLNLTTKAAISLVASRSAGLKAPRSIITKGSEIIVSAQLSSAVMVFDATNGSFKQTLLQINQPTGLIKDGDNHFLVNNSRSVLRVANDASTTETIVSNGAGSLSGGTFVYRMHKSDPDTDEDGLTDEEETNTYGTDPQDPDTDDDSLSDGDEVNIHATNPLVADTDSDGMPDGFEVTYALQPTLNDAAEDPDADALSNLDEYLAGTSPLNEDTDGDGVKDGEDFDPLVPNTPPVVSGTPINAIDQDQNYSFTPEVSYAGDIATIALSISNQPKWANFDLTDGKLSGTPHNDDVGLHSNIIISATNGYHIVDLASFDVEVNNVNDVPELTSNIPAQTLTLGNNLSFNISGYFRDIDRDISSGSQDSLTFSATGMPGGVSITEQGLISGTPSETATFTIIITATDQSNATASGELNLTVKAADVKVKSGGGGSSSFWLLLAFGLLVINRRILPKSTN